MHFEIRRSDNGYWWRIVGGNNEIMVASEITSRQNCINSIARVKTSAASAPVFDDDGGRLA